MTRPEPQASGTARRLAALGYTPLVAPLLQVVPVTGDGTEAGEGPGSANGIGTLALTSRTAALILAAHPAFHSLPVAAVGSATAAEARRAGFTRVNDAAGTVEPSTRCSTGSRARPNPSSTWRGASTPATSSNA
ncbi:uroporphyrinogen-III synthase [Stappia sp. 22II-S9-Z10]|nr:uroporphyrinogen-III synthase [Stappia sp. 22II-S9-Z10]